MRHKFRLNAPDFLHLKPLLLQLSKSSSHFSFFDSNNHTNRYQRYEWMVAFGVKNIFEDQSPECFKNLQKFFNEHRDWLFGHFNYDLKNLLENLSSQHEDKLGFPLLQFYIPETVVYQQKDFIFIESCQIRTKEEFLHFITAGKSKEENPVNITLKAQISREEYLHSVDAVLNHLQYGNIYELNYCMEFSAREKIDPVQVFQKLNTLSNAPFAAYYKCGESHLMCASPERYLFKEGDKIISQPIKGTARRSEDPETDLKLKLALGQNEKERSENVMIVDLVRNDLSRTAAKGTVEVEELFKIYSFTGVHQMISTITSKLKKPEKFCQAVEYSFPMGSMTGAPKISAMEIIDAQEKFRRSLYSGSVGYINPEGNFDFNVVIRSLFYNATTSYISARVGSAITIHCDPQLEYEECLLKAENLFKALNSMY